MNTITTFRGQRIDEMTREELIDALNWAGRRSIMDQQQRVQDSQRRADELRRRVEGRPLMSRWLGWLRP